MSADKIETNIARDLKGLLKPIGCWPPRCHACDRDIGESEVVTFVKTTCVETKRNYISVVHVGCSGLPVQGPTVEILDAQRAAQAGKPGRSYGAYVEVDAWRSFEAERCSS